MSEHSGEAEDQPRADCDCPSAPPAPAGPQELDFEQLYLRIAPLLRIIASRRFRVPPDDVGTLVHDVFLTFLRDPEHVRDPRQYLVGAICNAARTYQRRQASYENVFCAAETAEPCADPTFESLARVLDAGTVLARLRNGCRDVLRRYYLDEQTTDDIAEEMGTTAGAIRVRLHKCRETARKLYCATVAPSKPHAS